MCYSVLVSTTCEQRLDELKFSHIQFEASLTPLQEALLSWPHKWYLTTREFGGCSCHFRHKMEDEPPYFARPSEEYPEDEDDVMATQEVFAFFLNLIEQGFAVEAVSQWNEEPIVVETIECVLSADSLSQCRFVENHRMTIVGNA